MFTYVRATSPGAGTVKETITNGTKKDPNGPKGDFGGPNKDPNAMNKDLNAPDKESNNSKPWPIVADRCSIRSSRIACAIRRSGTKMRSSRAIPQTPIVYMLFLLPHS